MENDLFFNSSDSILFSDLGHESEVLPGDFEQSLFPSSNLSNGMEMNGVGDSSFDDIVANDLMSSFNGNEVFHTLESSEYSNSSDNLDIKPKFPSFSDSLASSTSSAINLSTSPPLSSSISMAQTPEMYNFLSTHSNSSVSFQPSSNAMPMYSVKTENHFSNPSAQHSENQNSMLLSPSHSSEMMGGAPQPMVSPVSSNTNSAGSFSLNSNGPVYAYSNGSFLNPGSNASIVEGYSSNVPMVTSHSASIQVSFPNQNALHSFETKPSSGKGSKVVPKGSVSPRRFTPIAPNPHQQSAVPQGRLIQHHLVPQHYPGSHQNFHMQQLPQQHVQIHQYHKQAPGQHLQSGQQFHSQTQHPMPMNNSFHKQAISPQQSQPGPRFQDSGFVNSQVHSFMDTKDGYQQPNQHVMIQQGHLTNSQYVQIQLNNQMVSSSSSSNAQQRFDNNTSSSPKFSPHLSPSHPSPGVLMFKQEPIRKSESCGNLLGSHSDMASDSIPNSDYMKSSPKCLPKSVIMPSPSLIQRAGAAVAAENPSLMHLDSDGDVLRPLPSDAPNGHVKRPSIMIRSYSSHALGQFRPLAPAPPVKPEGHMASLSRMMPVDGPNGLPVMAVRVPSNLSALSPMNGRPILPAVSGMRRVHSTGDIQTLNGMAMAHGMSPTGYDDGQFKIGRYTLEERRLRIHRYRQKRLERNFNKKIKYACRKTLADSRPRVRGRFAKNDDMRDEEDINDGDLVGEDEDSLLDDDSNEFSVIGSLFNGDINFDFKVDLEQPTSSC